MAVYPTTNAVPQVVQEGDLWSILATSGTIPERYLSRGMDNIGKAAFITKGTTKMLSMMTQRVPKPKQVNTREFRTSELNELDRTLTVIGAQDPAAPDLINVSARHGAQVQPGDVLYARNLYTSIDGSNIFFSTIFGLNPDNRYYIDQEPMLVVANRRGAGPNATDIIQVRRVAKGGGRSDFGGMIMPVPNIPANALLQPGARLLRGLPSFPEGSDAPHGFHAVPELDNNFTQEFKYAIELTKESSIEKTYLGQKPIEIYKLLKMRQATLDVERTLINGQKGKTMDRAGRVQYMTGGMIEYMLRDNRHFLDYLDITSQTSITYDGFLDVCNIMAANGGGSQKDMYVGITLYTALKKAWFRDNHMRYDDKASAKFDIPIEVIVGSGIELKVIPLYTMEEIGWGNKALILDTSVPSFGFVSHPDWDMKIETDIQQKGQQIYKEQWIGIKGVERRYAQYQHIVDFSRVVPITRELA